VSIEKVPPSIQAKFQKLIEYQELRARLARERSILESTKAELESLIKELEAMEDDVELYRARGIVLVKVDKKALLEELKKKVEDLELKLIAIKEQEKKIVQEIEKLAKELEAFRGGGGAPVGGAG